LPRIVLHGEESVSDCKAQVVGLPPAPLRVGFDLGRE
jgi:hypothetical protein